MIEIDENKQYSAEEIAEIFHYSISTVKRSWNRTAKELEKHGYIITKNNTDPKNIFFTIKKGQILDKYNISDLPGEIWTTGYYNNKCEVSNKGRIRDKVSHKLYKQYRDDSRGGYLLVQIEGKRYRVHRFVKLSFDPIENAENLVIDHIDGNRQNNNLDNLRYTTQTENTFAMLINRDKIQMAITEKLKHGWSYNEILEIINNLPNKIL